jgi:hypothetical protein
MRCLGGDDPADGAGLCELFIADVFRVKGVAVTSVTAGGVELRLDFEVPPGTALRVEWPSRGGQPPVRRRAWAVYTRPEAGGVCVLGAAFARGLEPAEMEAIRPACIAWGCHHEAGVAQIRGRQAASGSLQQNRRPNDDA